MFAIIGIGCRLPGGVNNPYDFYLALRNKRDCVKNISSDRWNRKYYQSDTVTPGTMVNHRCGLIEPYFTFDNDCFSLSKKEAMSLDPSSKILLEVALQCLEDSNVKYKGSNTGVFVGSGQMGFVHYHSQVPEYATEYSATGTSLAIHANMISYKFDLRGPSFVTESACSSSGSAMYLAMHALISGDVDMALIGGFNNLLNPSMTTAFSRLGVLSHDGKCKSFDASADGYVRSEGCGMILIKPFKQALRDGDHIYCVVKGVSANADGALEPSLTKPSKVSQFGLVKKAFEKSKIKPEDLYYFEAHATGTQVGDPVEINTIGKLCGKGKVGGDQLRLGSVKTNIGHCELGSFIASVIKVSVMIDRKELLPTIHQKRVNPKIKMKKYNMKVQTEVEKFDPHGKVFAVNSFGFGGANSCAVLQGWCNPKKSSRGTMKHPFVYIISARSREALKERVKQFQDFSRDGRKSKLYPELEDEMGKEERSISEEDFQLRLSYTMNTFARQQDRYTTFGIGQKCHEVKFMLPGMTLPEVKPAVCFVFSGQGPQNLMMGRQLYQFFPVFKKTVDRLDVIYKKLAGFSPIHDTGLFGSKIGKAEDVNKIMVTLAGLMFVQIGLWELVKSFGLHPTVIIGHSFGEMCAMYANGAVSLEQIVEVTVQRGILCQELEHLGKMIAVGCSVEDIKKIIKKHNISDLWISAENSPVSCTVGGLPDSIHKLDKLCEEQKIFHRILSITNAYHTPLLNPLREKADVMFGRGTLSKLGTPKIRFVSTVTGRFWKEGENFTPDYFFDNILSTVNFRRGVETVLREFGEHTVFLELAPHPVLGLSMKQCGAKNVIPTLYKGQNEQMTILQGLGRLAQFGYYADWSKVMGKGIQRIWYLPTYPFQRRDCFMFVDSLQQKRLVPEFFHDEEGKFAGALLGRRCDVTEEVWRGLMNTHKFPWLRDHVVHDATVFPGAGYIEICLEHMMTQYYYNNRKATPNKKEEGGSEEDEEEEEEVEGEEDDDEKKKKKKDLILGIRNVKILNPFVVPTDQIVFSTVEMKVDTGGNANISTRKQNSMGSWLHHMKCRVEEIKEIEHLSEAQPLPKVEGVRMTKREIYSRFEVLQNLRYGETFRLIEELVQGDEEVLAQLSPKHLEGIVHVNDWYVIHPALLDNIFQCFLVTYREMKTYLPTSIKRFEMFTERISPKDHDKIWVHCYLLDKSEKKLIGNCVVMDEEGKVLLKVEEFEFTSTSSAGKGVKEKRVLHTIWQPHRLGMLNEEKIRKKPEKPWEEIEKRFLPKLSSWIIKKIQPGLKRLKSLTIPKDKHQYMNWINQLKPKKGEDEELDDSMFEDYEGPYELEMNLVKNVVKFLPMLIRKKSDKLTEGKKRKEWISNFYSQASLTHRVLVSALTELFQNMEKKFGSENGEQRVIRILEIGTHRHFSFLDHLVPLIEPMEGRIEIITSTKLPKQSYSFVHFRKFDSSTPLTEQGIFPSSVDLVLCNGVCSLLEHVHDVLVDYGLLVVTEYRDENAKFVADFLFGPILEFWEPQNSISSQQLPEWVKSNGFDVQNLLHTNSTDILFARKDEKKKKKKKQEEEGEKEEEDNIDSSIQVFDDSSCFKLLDFVQHKISKKDFRPLLVVTKGVFDTKKPCMDWSANVGFVRVLQNEYLHWKIRLVDLPSDCGDEDKKKFLARMRQQFETLENESCLGRDGEMYVPRVVRKMTSGEKRREEKKVGADHLKIKKKKMKMKRKVKKTQPFRLYVDQPGLLDTLHFHGLESPSSILKSNAVYCKVHAASLNFKDVMLAMNMLKSFKPHLGLEFSGTVVNVGEDVKDIKIGDEVYGFADHALSSHVMTSRDLIQLKPKNLSHEQAASVPTIHLTTYIALIKKSQIQKGDKVLVHSAAGGIGQAALEWIKLREATPIATCGSNTKRDFLRNLGVKIFGNSHRDDWDREITSQLNGEKVDVVLNSLAKNHIMRGIRILKPFGSFVEIGKRDILNNSPMFLKPFLDNLSYFSVHIDRMIDQRPSLIRPLMKEMSGYLESGKIKPVKVDKVFRATEIKEAFRYMQSGTHMGKIVIQFCPKVGEADRERSQEEEEEEEKLYRPTILSKKTLFRSNKIYILSGGLGVLGFEIACWMVDLGARYIVLLSRSGKKTKSQIRRIKRLEKRYNSTLKICISKTDVSSKSQVEILYQKLFTFDPETTRNEFGMPNTTEIGGIIHLAMVLRDGRIPSLTRKKFEESFAPKITGARNLVECGEKMVSNGSFNPDFVIFFSSISATVGNLEQSNYSAANFFLDRYASFLSTQKGVYSKVINLGAVVDIGVIAENLTLRKIMEQGVLWGSAMTLGQVLQSIGQMVEDAKIQKKKKRKKIEKKKEEEEEEGDVDADQHMVQYIPDIDVMKLVEAYPRLVPKFGHLKMSLSMLSSSTPSDLEGGRIKEASAQTIQDIVGKLLMMDPKRVPLNEPLTRYGVDSLLAVEISSILKSKYDVLVSQMEILAGMTIDQILKVAEK